MDDIQLMVEPEDFVNCPWLKTGKINIGIISNWSDIRRDSADYWIESKIGNDISAALYTRLIVHSENNFPEWDIQFQDGNFFEIKIRTFSHPSKIFIETGTEIIDSEANTPRKKKSGLSLSKSDYYILLTPGLFPMGDNKVRVMKVRLIKTEILREIMETTAETFIQSPGAKKSYGFDIDLFDKDFDDGFMGYYLYNPDTQETDFSKFIRFNKNLSKIREVYKSNNY